MGEKLFLFACFMLLACSSLATLEHLPLIGKALSQKKKIGDDPSYKSMFILAGQSNMAGRGYENDSCRPFPPEYYFPNPQILKLDANQTWTLATEPGIHAGIDIRKGIPLGAGPGLPFANRILMKKHKFGKIGLIPCAHGGTKIMEWMKGSSTGHYKQLVDRSKFALQSGGEIKALLWYQGESDTKQYEDAMLYGSRLIKFLTDVRTDLELPDLPVLVVRILNGEGNYTAVVRQTQMELKLSNVVTVDVDGAEIKGDKLHLSTAGALEVGKRLAHAFLKINKRC